VRSIALGEPAALVDGNVARVLARWHALDTDPMQGKGRAAVWQFAAAELDTAGPARNDAASWNQALMELGATVCIPRSPDCRRCPVAAGCAAYAKGLQSSIPPPRKKAAVQAVTAWSALIGGQGEGHDLLVCQRGAQGRWAGLWEPPAAEQDPQPLHDWLAAHGLQVTATLAPITHILTHRRYTVHGLRCQAVSVLPASLPPGYTAMRWVSLGAALSAGSGLSRLAQRLAEGLAEGLPLGLAKGLPTSPPAPHGLGQAGPLTGDTAAGRAATAADKAQRQLPLC
jgi:A/G-specific adenine glycosylase